MLVSLILAKTTITLKALEFTNMFAAVTCGQERNQGLNKLFGFPTWYEYLPKRNPNVDLAGQQVCSPHISSISDIWLIGLAIVEILLRVAVIAAIIYVMLGGMKYVNARGNAEKTESAKKTVIDALIGLIIAVTATAVVTFIGGRFGG